LTGLLIPGVLREIRVTPGKFLLDGHVSLVFTHTANYPEFYYFSE